ncbi:MAG TPA: hypothetical protein VMT37_07060 [Solirubrobacterales bacterium]|nr:hypothetical protein [Solirubrobacterales bacterium]
MLARVVRWEGADAAALEASAAGIRQQVEESDGPPPGVPAKRLLILQDAAAGKTVAITLFETEADYAEGDATLSSMSPPGDGMGQRVAVEKLEVVVEAEA